MLLVPTVRGRATGGGSCRKAKIKQVSSSQNQSTRVCVGTIETFYRQLWFVTDCDCERFSDSDGRELARALDSRFVQHVANLALLTELVHVHSLVHGVQCHRHLDDAAHQLSGRRTWTDSSAVLRTVC